MTYKKPSVLVVDRKSIAGNNRQSMSVQVRLLEPLRYLEAAGKIHVIELDESVINEKDIVNADLLAMSRSYSSKAVELMRSANSLLKPILYDVDDDMFVLPKWTALDTAEFEKHKNQLLLASYLTVPLVLLSERLSWIDTPVMIIPTATVMNKFETDNVKRNNKIVYTNLMDIKLESARADFLKAVFDFMTKNPDLELDVFSDSALEICNIHNVNYCGFLEYREYKKKLFSEKYLFALCPLSGSEDQDSFRHNECKSPIKYIDYSAAKIPAIFSNSPAYVRSIQHGENGLITENTYESWLHTLEFMYKNTQIREKIAEKAFLDIYENYNMKIVSEKWFEVIHQLTAQ